MASVPDPPTMAPVMVRFAALVTVVPVATLPLFHSHVPAPVTVPPLSERAAPVVVRVLPVAIVTVPRLVVRVGAIPARVTVRFELTRNVP